MSAPDRISGTAEVAKDADGAASICTLLVADRLYGIDTHRIREVLRTSLMQRVPLAHRFIAGVVPYHGDVLTTVSLRALLQLPEKTGKNCIMVFDCEQDEERFGLMVDRVGGVVAMEAGAVQANPCGLDARSQELFDGTLQTASGLMVHLDPRKLSPSRLAASEIFAETKQNKQQRQGEDR